MTDNTRATGGRGSRTVLLVATPLGIAAALGIPHAILIPIFYDRLLERYRALRIPFDAADAASLVDLLMMFSMFCGCAMLIGFLAAFVRRRWALSIARKCYLLVPLWVLLYTYVIFDISGIIQAREIALDGVKPEAVAVFFWRWNLVWPAGVAAFAALAGYILAWRRSVMNVYGDSLSDAAMGDRVIENVRTNGAEPVYRKSILGSLGAHIFVIILLPILLQMGGCVEPYRVPFGSGNPVVALVKIVKPKKEKKKKFILRPDSAIYFNVPDLDQSEMLKQVQEMSQLTYKADPNAMAGKMGRGGGTTGGWPEGVKDGLIRFIRLEYNGPGWDDGMDSVSRADINFLQEFQKLTGFKVAPKGEAHAIRLLRKYEKGFAPPFVYMTGHGGISVSADELKVLRDYLMDGGMLFADCGSPGFDRNFRHFASAIFPGEPLRVIADDDPIFQMPYTFASGAPPLWHHGGWSAMGIKYKGRWVVFYHPGDVNDAWKTGHSGMNPELARGAFQMGVNIVYYAFSNYLELTAKYRK